MKVLRAAILWALLPLGELLDRYMYRSGLAAYAVTPGFENPQQPSETTEVFTPDQLIAGRFPLVTAQDVLVGGAAAYQRGTVMGQQSLGAISSAAHGGNTGNGTVTALTRGVDAKVGVYTLKFTGATTANVLRPDGAEIAPMTAAGAYASDDINFTFTAGGTPMIAGDSFLITIAAGGGVYIESVATATDGSQVPSGILGDYTDATGGNVNAAMFLTGEFNGNALTYDDSWTLSALTAALRPLSIFIRTALPATGDITNH